MSRDFECFEPGPELRTQVFRLWERVFASWSGETKKIIADRLEAGFRAGTVRTPAVRLRKTGQLIAALRLEAWRFAAEVPGEAETGVHVGEVAVLPEFQGQGAGTLLMDYAVRLLKETEPRPDFAFLGGYTGFYGRFGFRSEDSPSRLEIPLAPERGGVRRFPVTDRLPQADPGLFRPFLPETDGESVMKLQTPAPGERIIDADMLKREFIFRRSCDELACFVTPAQGPPRGFVFLCGNSIYNSGFADEKVRDLLLSEALRRIAATGAAAAVISANTAPCEAYCRARQLPFRRLFPVGGLCSAMRLDLRK